MSRATKYFARSTLLVAALCCYHGSPDAGGAGAAVQLADLVLGVVSCDIHPCFGDREGAVRILLNDQIVTDDSYYYSDLNVAYPETDGAFRGVVAWDLDDHLDSIMFIILDFSAAPGELIEELALLPDCEMDSYSADEWFCAIPDSRGEEIDIDVYFAPGMVLLDLY